MIAPRPTSARKLDASNSHVAQARDLLGAKGGAVAGGSISGAGVQPRGHTISPKSNDLELTSSG